MARNGNHERHGPAIFTSVLPSWSVNPVEFWGPLSTASTRGMPA